MLSTTFREHFHVVFTVPEEIADIALQNKRTVYGILFRAAAQTLQTIAADPQHLGAQIGFFAVLHTGGAEPTLSSSFTLCGERRGSVCGWHPMDWLPSGLLLARTSALSALSPAIPGPI